jgi:hypothetical protein
MWPRVILAAAMIIATVRGASGQMGTADGVAALARGDYRRAVEILRPIAEDWRSDDTAAQFFMAGLYETGRGVSADPLRACALYQRASSKHDHPFGQEAFHLFAALTSRGGTEFDHECQLLANLGFDHGFEPVTFNLGPAHSVEWTLTAATVTYQGRTKRQEMGIEVPGARFLPLQHTELATGPTRALTRHFIDVFVWEPSARSVRWTLRWHLFEVVRDQLIRIDTVESLATIDGDVPPSRESFDVREYVVLRVDDEGNAEWALLKEPRPATQRIESDAERREVRQAALARDTALARVDWSRRYEVHRQPTMSYVDADGCGSVHVYGWTADRAEAVLVSAKVAELGPSTQAATFDLARDSVNISVQAHMYDAPQRDFHFCSDVVMPRNPDQVGPEIWRAVAGTVSIELSPSGIRARNPAARRATVTLSNVVVRNAAGTTVSLPRTIRLSAIVGWVAG